MNEIPRFSALREPLNPLIHPLDAILADIAINCQLPPSLFSKAVDRYEAVRAHIERPGSPLEGKVACFYPQGSMGIDATISIRGTDDEYDLDIVAELEIPDAVTPEQALDILEKALEDYPVTKVIRQTRCVTLKYADRMHLDITPSRRLRTLKERESVIFHSKKGSSRNEQLLVPANSFAFVNWYRMRTPLERRFAYEFNRRLYDHAGIEFRADAEVHDVPKQTPLIVKSVTTVAHQLIKRFRNILYITATGRIPPSVMLACHAGHAASPGMTLSDMVVRQARWTTRAINDAERDNSLIDVRNPEWSEDKFTDRWPENRKQQQEFARGLTDLANGLEAIKRGDVELEDLQGWLRSRFGETVVSRSLKTFNRRTGEAIKSSTQGYTRSGGLYVPATPAIIGAAASSSHVAARSHTNMGERR